MIVCSICIYTGPRPTEDRPEVTDGADPDDHVVVMNGQSVCVDHAGLVGNGGDRRYMIMTEVRARGFDSLSALQDHNYRERRARDDAPPPPR